ncbi:hypothetical protein RDI58_008376 [Solanum bulbocastanum]|uniref:P-type phospholipid transporter n=1 Tax=Solanum bulbocastanum TaxID=147425 RepID=A0AAN8YN24_SOLBU
MIISRTLFQCSKYFCEVPSYAILYGVVIFTGHDTKGMQNSTDPPSKKSGIEKKMDKICPFWRWYLQPDKTSVFYDSKRASLTAFFHFLTAPMLYGYLIHISLYVLIEIVKVLQSIFINQDREMYYGEKDKPAHARTSNLNEELGLVDTILSIKTDTLTCYSMEFVKCSIAGEISYEVDSPDEAAFVIAARQLGFQFFERTQSRITLHELNHQSGKMVDR